VNEAGRQGMSLGEVMAMTEHRSVGIVTGYFQAGSLLASGATQLLQDSYSNQLEDVLPLTVIWIDTGEHTRRGVCSHRP
jgi:hypothetical protein